MSFVYTHDMQERNQSTDPEGFELVSTWLRSERPALSDEQLERVRRRIRPPRPASSRGQPMMRFRLAVSAMLAAGVVFSGGGAALALSGSSGQGQAAGFVYPDNTPPGEPEVLGEQTPPVEQPSAGNTNGQSDQAAAPELQAPRQTATVPSSGERELPFTGLAAIPVIALGVALLIAGVLLRRRTTKLQS